MDKILRSAYFRSVAWALILTIGSWTPLEAYGAVCGAERQRQVCESATAQRLDAASPKQHRTGARELSDNEMRGIVGRGQYRSAYLCGTMPWHRSFHDVNLCTGNLMKSFTDIQAAPARGAGLVLQRTYNSNDDQIGPFGRGWTHAYEIRVQEATSIDSEILDENGNPLSKDDRMVRTDFFGGKHIYKRDADGLYTPAPYMHNWIESDYDDVLEAGPQPIVTDLEYGLDGAAKHYILDGTARICDYIEDRHGNRTTLEYTTYTVKPNVTSKLLTCVTDPSGRELNFTWQPQSPSDPSDYNYRITSVTGPASQQVDYEYYTSPSDPGAGGEAYNLEASYVYVGGGKAPRTTVYEYTTADGETGLLSSIKSLLVASPEEWAEVSYEYSATARSDSGCSSGGPTYTGTVWVTKIVEPAGIDDDDEWVLDGTTVTWDVFCCGPVIGGDHQYVGGVVNNIGIEAPSYADLSVWVGSDAALRTIRVWVSNLYGAGTNNEYQAKFEYDDYDVVAVTRPLRAQYRDPSYEWISYIPLVKDRYEYGQFGKPLRHWVEGFTGEDYEHPAQIYEYWTEDKYFQQKSITDAEGNVTRYDYYDRYASSANRGNVAWVRDARYSVTGEQFEYQYNNYGQKTQETNLNNVVTTFDYADAWGNLTEVVQDPGSSPHLNRTTSMIYDAAGRVTSRTDPNGDASTVAYNLVGQPLEAAYVDETITYTYRDDGSLLTVADDRGTISIDYEPGCSRVSSVTDPITGAISYTYSRRGSVTKKTLPEGGEWTYEYMTAEAPGGLGSSQGNPDEFQEELTKIWYKGPNDECARVVAGALPDEFWGGHGDVPFGGYGFFNGSWFYNMKYDDNGTPSICDDDLLVSYCRVDNYCDGEGGYFDTPYSHGRLVRTVNTYFWKDGATWFSYLLSQNDYTCDDAGNRLTNIVQVRDSSGTLNTWTETYGYDELYRLTSAGYTAFGIPTTQSYTFDPMGNRLTLNDIDYGYNNANMLTTIEGATYATYDDNGNQLTGGGRENAWDSQNRLVECVIGAKTWTYQYGADGLRRRTTVEESGQPTKVTDYVLDGQSVVREFRNEGPWATYLIGARGVEYRQDDTQTGTPRLWNVYDGLGSVLATVNEAGVVQGARVVDVYGNPRDGGGPLTGNWFVGGLGHTYDDDPTGLIYMRARWYDPVTGRFVSEDPAKDGVNWYAYCNGNPVTQIDFDGRSSIYGAAAAVAWFVYLTYQFIKSDTTNLKNDLRYMWGLAAMALYYDAAKFASKSNYIMDAVRDITKSAGKAEGSGYAWIIGGVAAGYGLTLLFVSEWCTDFESGDIQPLGK